MYLNIVAVTASALGFLVTLAQADPQKITLMPRTKPRISSRYRARTIAGAPTTVPLDENTDLEWFGNISVGTPPQLQTVIFNTQILSMRFTSTLCGSPCDKQLKFDPSKSSTFVDGGYEVRIQAFRTVPGIVPPTENDTMDLRNGTDTVSVGGLSVANIELDLITNQTGRFNDDHYSGFIGLSSDKNTGFFAALINQGLPSLFSLYLTPKSVGNAEIILGGIDESKFKGDPIFASLKDNGWSLAASGFFINGQATPFDSNLPFTFGASVSNVVLSTNTANAIYAKISSDIKPYPNEPGAYGIPCHLIPSISAQIDITFTSQEGVSFNLTIPSSEFNLGPFAQDPSICQTIINAFGLIGTQIMGISLIRHYITIWDVGGQRLGFVVPN